MLNFGFLFTPASEWRLGNTSSLDTLPQSWSRSRFLVIEVHGFPGQFRAGVVVVILV